MMIGSCWNCVISTSLHLLILLFSTGKVKSLNSTLTIERKFIIERNQASSKHIYLDSNYSTELNDEVSTFAHYGYIHGGKVYVNNLENWSIPILEEAYLEANTTNRSMKQGEIIIHEHKTSRRHFLRLREAQSCNIRCGYNDNVCKKNANDNRNCNGFTKCVNRFCSNSEFERCNLYCGNNPNICDIATDGCIVCNGQICTRPNKCNIYCKNDFVCSGAADGCIRCVRNRCTRGDGKCGQFCQNNPLVCQGADDGCNFCNGYNCVSNGAPICGSPCSNNNGCRGAVNGCTLCLNGRCSRGDNRVCVNSASTLQSSLQTGGNVEICGGSLIKLTNEIITSTNNILLTCGGGTCTISGNGSNRLIHFTGGNIQIRGIIFEGGRADGDGGGILIDGNDNQIANCNFQGNRAMYSIRTRIDFQRILPTGRVRNSSIDMVSNNLLDSFDAVYLKVRVKSRSTK